MKILDLVHHPISTLCRVFLLYSSFDKKSNFTASSPQCSLRPPPPQTSNVLQLALQASILTNLHYLSTSSTCFQHMLPYSEEHCMLLPPWQHRFTWIQLRNRFSLYPFTHCKGVLANLLRTRPSGVLVSIHTLNSPGDITSTVFQFFPSPIDRKCAIFTSSLRTNGHFSCLVQVILI